MAPPLDGREPDGRGPGGRESSGRGSGGRRGGAGKGAATPPSCHERALRLLAVRPHFRAELGAKLIARGYDADEVAATLDRLVASGLLDDAEAVRSFVAVRQRRQGCRTRHPSSLSVVTRRRGRR